jgi:hypothetical protein
MMLRADIGFAEDVLGEVTEEHVNWPHFRGPEAREMGRVRPKHECSDDLLALAIRIVWR